MFWFFFHEHMTWPKFGLNPFLLHNNEFRKKQFEKRGIINVVDRSIIIVWWSNIRRQDDQVIETSLKPFWILIISRKRSLLSKAEEEEGCGWVRNVYGLTDRLNRIKKTQLTFFAKPLFSWAFWLYPWMKLHLNWQHNKALVF